MENDLRCPQCGSNRVAEILWGKPADYPAIEAAVEAGELVIGGCLLPSNPPPDHQCLVCSQQFFSADGLPGQQDV